LGTPEEPHAYHIRVSNHDNKNYGEKRYDCDICASKARKDATTYIKFLIDFATEHDKVLPFYFKFIVPGTECYKDYSIELQKRASDIVLSNRSLIVYPYLVIS
jgi:hypothetical protein